MIAERFTTEAREAVKAAVRDAERVHAGEVGVEYLLLALLDTPVLAGFDLPREELEQEFRDYRRKGGLTKADAEALRGLGIDVDAVIDSVEQSPQRADGAQPDLRVAVTGRCGEIRRFRHAVNVR